MNVKKERLHQCGLSNIDFKRLNDKEMLTKYKDDMRETNFGLMGRSRVPYAYEVCDFGKRASLQIHGGFKVPEPPNPRLDEAKKYYIKRKKPFRLPSQIASTRTTQLEDHVWNEKVFTGEDVGRLTWYNNNVLGSNQFVASSSEGGSPLARKSISIVSLTTINRQNEEGR